jgi:hypothetical protein
LVNGLRRKHRENLRQQRKNHERDGTHAVCLCKFGLPIRALKARRNAITVFSHRLLG